MRKQLYSLFAMLIIAAMILAACQPAATATVEPQVDVTEAPAETEAPVVTEAPAETEAPPASGDVVEIRWFVGLGTGTDANQVEVENQVVEAFNAEHPNIKLVLEVVNYESARDTLATEMASGNPPDIVGPVGVQGSEAFHGQWLDLTTLVQAANYDLTQFDEASVDFYRVGGQGLIGLPFASYPSMVYYQRDAFDEAGLNYPPHQFGEKYVWEDGTEAEWNFETLRQVAMRLTIDTNGNDATSPDFDPNNIVQYGYEPQYQDTRAAGSYFGAGTLVAEDGKTVQIPSAWADSWKWIYTGIWTDHFIMNDAVRQTEEMATGNPFDSGRVAMAITHLWYTCCLAEAGENWDLAFVPSYNGATTSNFNADTFRITEGSQHPEEAFEVMTYLIGPASMQLLGIYGGMPARIADQPAYLESLKEQFPWDVDWQVVIDSFAYPDIPSFESYMPSYNEAVDRTNTFWSLMLTTEGLDMDQEIETLKSDLQAIFDKQQ